MWVIASSKSASVTRHKHPLVPHVTHVGPVCVLQVQQFSTKGKPMTDPTPNPAAPAPKVTHMYILVDRSGSMESIASDVIGGFNQTVAEQAQNGPDAKLTVIQFDSQDPANVMYAGIPIAEMTKLDRTSYQPRGGTPLLDATGLLIGRIRVEQAARVATGLQTEDVMFVTITDGQENESREYNLARVTQLIEQCKAEGWTFVYLSAAITAYADAAAMGYDHGSTQQFQANTDGSGKAFASMSRGMSNMRDKKRAMESYDSALFFETGKDAEDK